MKTVLTIIFSLITVLNFANDSTNCRCKYYSSYDFKKYKNNSDSIGKVLSEKIGKVMMIGFRSFSAANLLFIVETNSGYEALSYDLVSGKNKKIIGRKVNELASKILTSSTSIDNSGKIPSKYISHDLSYFVSYNIKKGMFEVCQSQIMSVEDKDIGKLFLYYSKEFK
ncbi:hypothetical protein ACI6Q2_22460 [Chitinophagaceae bacterium LWZ2-11]